MDFEMVCYHVFVMIISAFRIKNRAIKEPPYAKQKQRKAAQQRNDLENAGCHPYISFTYRVTSVFYKDFAHFDVVHYQSFLL